MNPISKIHKHFSELLKNPGVLTNPEEFLGENYESVLNFWLILDELSEEQLRIVKERYRAFYAENNSEWWKTTDLAWNASEEVIGDDYTIDSSRAAHDATDSWVAAWATLELIGIHKILEDRQRPLMFFPMFLEVL
jgi:hypothetical protein